MYTQDFHSIAYKMIHHQNIYSKHSKDLLLTKAQQGAENEPVKEHPINIIPISNINYHHHTPEVPLLSEGLIPCSRICPAQRNFEPDNGHLKLQRRYPRNLEIPCMFIAQNYVLLYYAFYTAVVFWIGFGYAKYNVQPQN